MWTGKEKSLLLSCPNFQSLIITRFRVALSQTEQQQVGGAGRIGEVERESVREKVVLPPQRERQGHERERSLYSHPTEWFRSQNPRSR